jgi:hypothetical protein
MAFDKLKQVYDLQRQAKEIQKKLAAQTITATTGDGAVEVAMTGEQKVKAIRLNKELIDFDDITKLEKQLESAVTQAITKSQQVAADEMKEITGGLGLPGM